MVGIMEMAFPPLFPTSFPPRIFVGNFEGGIRSWVPQYRAGRSPRP
jgi:hypothetical protein